jgi:hypothetical protein
MKRFAMMGLITMGMVLLTGSTASAQQTATGRWAACRGAAWSEANTCYQNSSGYWGDVACGFELNLNLAACDNALRREIAF